MKKILHGLSIVLLVFLPLVFGGAMVYGSLFNQTVLNDLLSPVQNSAWIGVLTGAVLILLPLLYLLTLGNRRPKAKFISFQSESGGVSISVNAVRDYIRKVCEEFGAVVSIDPKIRSEKEQIGIDLDVKVHAGSRIPELSQMLQHRVRESIREGLGVSEVSDIKVRVQEIVGKINAPTDS